MKLNCNRFLLHFLCLVLLAACSTGETDKAENIRRPNILFAIADDASFPHMGAYGCTWVSTPAFDRVAQGWAAIYARLYSQCQMRLFTHMHSYGKEFLATGRGSQPQPRFPHQIHHLYGGAR